MSNVQLHTFNSIYTGKGWEWSSFKLFIRKGQNISSEMLSSGNVHSSKSQCTAEIPWFDQRLKAEQAAFWCPTQRAAGPLASPSQSWQELRSWAHTTCQHPPCESSAPLASEAKRPCRTSVRDFRNFLYSHHLVITCLTFQLGMKTNLIDSELVFFGELYYLLFILQ